MLLRSRVSAVCTNKFGSVKKYGDKLSGVKISRHGCVISFRTSSVTFFVRLNDIITLDYWVLYLTSINTYTACSTFKEPEVNNGI